MCSALALVIWWDSLQPAQSDDSAVQKPRISDHWQVSPSKTLALVWSLDRKTPLILQCDKGNGLNLIIPPEKTSHLQTGHYPATIVFDHNTTITQTWLAASNGGWATFDAYPDFASLLAMLKTHQEVEFVLARPETDPIDSQFTLNGAASAIDAIVGECRGS